LAHRNLGSGQTLNQGWTELVPGATAASAAEINPMIAVAGSNPAFWRFLKTGAYLVTVTMWIAGGAPAIPNQTCIGLFREPSLGPPGIEWARASFGPGAGAQSLTALVLARADDNWWVAFYRNTAGSQSHGPTTMYVSPVGPCRVGGAYDYAVLAGHVDYNSAGSTVSSYSITPPVSSNIIVPGDWMYLVHMNYYSATNPTVTPPQGWEVLVPQQPRTTSPEGISWGIWRKKYVAGDVCDVGLSLATYVRASLIVVRQQTDERPVLSNMVAPRQGVGPSKITVPGGLAESISMTVAMQHTPGVWTAPPPTVASPGKYWFTTGAPGTENIWQCFAWNGPPVTNTGPIDFTWSGVNPDAGQIAGITLSWPRVALP